MNARGSVMLEGLVAFLPLFAGFLGLCQVCDRVVHQSVLGRAAVAAARAGVVVLPDDGRHYGDPGQRAVGQFSGGRKAAIERVVESVLGAAEGFLGSGSGARTVVEVHGGTLVARVEAEYACLISSFCHRVPLRAEARLPYPRAEYDYVTRE